MTSSAFPRHLTRPITIAEFMRLSLFAQGGYYREKPAIGADFITAPEISQMFGELIGLWAADCWQRLGRPDPFLLVELGPGRGTLMQDFLRAARKVDGFIQAKRLFLVEINSALKKEQSARLEEYKPQTIETFADLPPGPAIIIANEFFDCLPIHQFARMPQGWQEVGIASHDGGFSYVHLPPGPQRMLADNGGDFVEVSPMGTSLASFIGQRLAQQDGVCLVIDYGYEGEDHGNTLQAVKDHKKISALAAPGSSDLTAHVNFKALKKAASQAGARIFGPIGQGEFLIALGIEHRAKKLDQMDAFDRLTQPGQMGQLFKAMAISGAAIEALAGFND